jgi:hypothetical protein
LRFLLPLTVLVVAPLLGMGGRAQAGYDAPVSLDRPSADSFLIAPQLDSNDLGAAAPSDESGLEPYQPRDDAPVRPDSPYLSQSGSPIFGAASPGANAPSPSHTAGAQGGSHTPALASQSSSDAPTLVGVLFLKAASHRPPPFPSRLFRPPRLS